MATLAACGTLGWVGDEQILSFQTPGLTGPFPEARELRHPDAGLRHLLVQHILLILGLALQVKTHNLTVNLTTFRVWCYACEKEVFLEQRLAAHPPGPSPKFSEQVRGCRGPAGGGTCRGQGSGSQMVSVPAQRPLGGFEELLSAQAH